ncbi:GNAT family N-acetyltransferase [Ectobacillus sp. sgz5001026]|uniref:GNAT family N-acetyltransferase n=1 Tax=Ectobacillus sp. sgz5001026 TaxID=3242473 RepID=UPI0036D4239F
MLLSQFPTLETERCLLREIISSDEQQIFEYFSDPQVLQYYGLEPFTRREQAEQFIMQMQTGIKSGSILRWGIEKKDNHSLIGTIGFHNWSKSHHRAEIGYELNHKEWNKGFMTEVLATIIPYGFGHLALNRIGAVVRKENVFSRRVLEKFGFREEGNLQEYQFYLGQYYDLLMYGLVQRTFLNRKTGENS